MVASIILTQVTLARDFIAYFGGVKYEYRAEGMDIIV